MGMYGYVWLYMVYGIQLNMVYLAIWVCMAVYGIWNTTIYGIFGYMGRYGYI